MTHFPGNLYTTKTRLNRMLLNHLDKSGIIRFKYYGEFDTMNKIHYDCQDDLSYIGNSNIDGSPIFTYYYDNINHGVIEDGFKKLNILLRILKLKYYSRKKLTKKEQSLLSFFKFFMIAYDNLELKGVSDREIDLLSSS